MGTSTVDDTSISDGILLPIILTINMLHKILSVREQCVESMVRSCYVPRLESLEDDA